MNVLVIGAGHRVKEAILPVLHNRNNDFVLLGIFSRTAKVIEITGSSYSAKKMQELNQSIIDQAQLIYVAVDIYATPNVVSKLLEYDVQEKYLLLDTPGFQVQDIRCLDWLKRFNHVWVAEDMITLPWLDTVQKAQDYYKLGEIKEIILDQSGWKYHGIALCKRLLPSYKLLESKLTRSSRCEDSKTELEVLSLSFESDKKAKVIIPRDYSKGEITIVFENATISTETNENHLILEGIVEDKQCIGFSIGNCKTSLSPHEKQIFGALPPACHNIHVVRRMHDCKRVGLSRLLNEIVEGRGAYPLLASQDDLWIGYFLSKSKHWKRNAFNTVDSAIFRFIARVFFSFKTIIKSALRLIRK